MKRPKKAVLVLFFTALTLLITSCSNEQEKTNKSVQQEVNTVANSEKNDTQSHDTTQPNEELKPTPSKTITVIPPADPTPTPKQSVKPKEHPEKISNLNPEQANKNTISGNLPEGLNLGKGRIFAPASKLDGNNSFIVVEYSINWKEAAEYLKQELESDSWVCSTCIQFSSPENTPETQSWRYTMNMEKKGMKLIVIVKESKNGSQADLNYLSR